MVRPRTFLMVLMLVLGAGRIGAAQQQPTDAQVSLLAIDHPGGNSNPRPQGLSAWLNETRQRTSIDIALAPTRVPVAELPRLLQQPTPPSPLLVWQGDSAFEPLPEQASLNLGKMLRSGASLLIDASDGVADGPFERSVVRELGRIFPNLPLVPVAHDHVLYKSFYLVDRHTGRTGSRAQLLGITYENRLAVVMSSNDLLGAMAKDPSGGWAFSVADGDRAREMATRLCVNWIMYALCLDYKQDQVHLPFLLKRRH